MSFSWRKTQFLDDFGHFRSKKHDFSSFVGQKRHFRPFSAIFMTLLQNPLHDCINLDDPTCEPYIIENDVLMSPTGFSNTSNWADLHASCIAITDSLCEAMTCIVESQFLSSLLEIYIENDFNSVLLYGTGGPLDAGMKHGNGFDEIETCSSVGGSIGGVGGGNNGAGGNGGVREKKCCGVHPVRYPYMTNHGNRDCCGYKTFEAALMQCCEDESIQMVCG